MKYVATKAKRLTVRIGVVLSPFFETDDPELIEEIEQTALFKNGLIKRAEPGEVADAPAPSVEPEFKHSRKNLFEGRTFRDLSRSELINAAFFLGYTDRDVAGLRNNMIWKLIKDRTVK